MFNIILDEYIPTRFCFKTFLGDFLKNMTLVSVAPDIHDVEATDEGFEETPQEDIHHLTIGSLVESEPFGWLVLSNKSANHTKTRRSLVTYFFVIIVIYS